MSYLIKVTIAIVLMVVFVLLLVRIISDRSVMETENSLQSESDGTVFTSEMIAGLDEPVRRYFLQAIEPGTPIANYVELEMNGGIRRQPDEEWLPMQASQTVSTSPGFIWKATIGRGIIKSNVVDRYDQNKGSMRIFLGGFIPLVNAQDEDIKRSAAGRLAGEYALWLPSALLPQNNVSWKAVSNNTIQANFKIDNEPISLTLKIDNNGKLQEISLMRWGDKTKDGSWQYIPFGGEIEAHQTFSGYTIASQVTAGWWFGTNQYSAFFQSAIDQAKFNSKL